MPAAAYLPPTSPYLQALERASVRQKYAPGKQNDEDDDDVCWVCGNPTPASQAYCSNTCRDADERAEPSVLTLDSSSGVQYVYEESSPLLSPAVSAVPALVPSRRSNNGNKATAASGHGNNNTATARYSPVVKASKGNNGHSSCRPSNDQTGQITSKTKNGASSTSAKDSNNHNGTDKSGANVQQLTHPNVVSGQGGTSNATTGKVSASSSRRHSSSRVLSSVLEDDRSNAPCNGTITSNGKPGREGEGRRGGALSSAGEGGSSSSPPSSSATSSPTKTVDDDDQIEEDIENLLLPPPIGSYAKKSPGFDYAYGYGVPPSTVVIPKSPPVKQSSAFTSTSMRKSSSSQQNNTSNKIASPLFSPKSVPAVQRAAVPQTSASAVKDGESNTRNASEVITFRRRHHAPDSMNGHQKSSHVQEQSTQSQSQSHHPASGSTTAVSSAAASPALLASRRHSSHGSSTLSPLMKAQSTISRTTSTAASTASSSPKLRPLTPSTTLSSPSPAASSLSSLLKRTTSKGDSVHSHLSMPPTSPYNNKPSSKSEILLRPSMDHRHSSSSSFQHPKTDVEQDTASSTQTSWLQRNKIAKTIFALNNPRSNKDKTSLRSAAVEAHPTCGRKGCPVAHAAGVPPPAHPLANFFTPLTRRSTEPTSPFASPAIQYYDAPDPFEESFSSANDRRAIEAADAIKRRPSLSASITAPPTTSPTSMKMQDYSGFAGFLFALHNQRKSAASSSPDSHASKTGEISSKAATAPAYDLESSESGYDAQDEEHQDARGRGRSSRKLNSMSDKLEGNASKTGSESKAQALLAQPALLKQKLVNVVRASNDPSGKSPASVEADENTSARSVSRPTRFLFGRGNAFKNSLNVSQVDTEDEISSVSPAPADEELIEHSKSPEERESRRTREDRSRKVTQDTYPERRPRHNHSTSVGEGSQYIVTMRDRSSDSSEDSGGSSRQSKPSSDREDGRGRARRRSAEGRYPVVSPFTTLERSQTHPEPVEETGRGRSRQRGSAAFHRSVSPARSSSRARGRDSPRLRAR